MATFFLILLGLLMGTVAGAGLYQMMLFALACNAIVWIATAVYFVPEILWFTKFPKDAPATPELAARGRRWLSLQWIRIVLRRCRSRRRQVMDR